MVRRGFKRCFGPRKQRSLFVIFSSVSGARKGGGEKGAQCFLSEKRGFEEGGRVGRTSAGRVSAERGGGIFIYFFWGAEIPTKLRLF